MGRGSNHVRSAHISGQEHRRWNNVVCRRALARAAASLSATGFNSVRRSRMPIWMLRCKRGGRLALWLVVMAILGASCGSNASVAQSTPTPQAQFLTGKGTKWQVVIKAVADVTGVALDGHGDIYLAEINADRIEEYSVAGKLITTFGTHGSGPGQLYNPAKVVVDAQRGVYVSDNSNNRIQKFSYTGQPLAQWGGPDAGSDPGKFNFPIGMAVDSDGDVFAVDAYNYRIQKLSPQGRPVAQWSSQGSKPPPLRVPYDIALDGKGHLYVSYVHGDDGVERFSTAGMDLGPVGGFGSDPGKFSTPTGMAVDSTGNIYVLDADNNRIQELSSSGQFLAQWAGPTHRPFVIHTEMAMDSTGNAYVSSGNLILRLCLIATGCS